MTRITEFRKTLTDSKPLMAYVGATDLAVEKARAARVQAKARRSRLQADYAPAKLQVQATELPNQAAKVVSGLATSAQELPVVALNLGLELAGQAQTRYDDLAARGEQLVTRVRTQQATKDLLAQAEATVALGKGALTTARNGAAEVERSAKALLTTGRKEATKAVDTIADSVADEAAAATTEVKRSAKATRTAARRTSTTTKKAAARTRTTAKATTTSARKTAAGATKATTKAADKVGA